MLTQVNQKLRVQTLQKTNVHFKDQQNHQNPQVWKDDMHIHMAFHENALLWSTDRTLQNYSFGHLYKPIEYAIPRVNPGVNYQLWICYAVST